MSVRARELAQIKHNLTRRAAWRSKALQERLSEARRDSERIVEHTARACQPRRINLWGSLVGGHHSSECSDIDIALERITNAASFFAILAEAEYLTCFPIDLVQLETSHPAYGESIRPRGRIVYER